MSCREYSKILCLISFTNKESNEDGVLGPKEENILQFRPDLEFELLTLKGMGI